MKRHRVVLEMVIEEDEEKSAVVHLPLLLFAYIN